MKMRLNFELVIILVTIFSQSCAETLSYPYNMVIPTSADLPKEQAERVAIEYYNDHTDRRYFDNEFTELELNSERYTIFSNLIRLRHNSIVQYSWVVSIIDTERVAFNSTDQSIGIVVVDSPSGNVELFSDKDFQNTSYILFDYLEMNEQINPSIKREVTSVQVNAVTGPLILPPDGIGSFALPDAYDIRSIEAEDMAYNIVAKCDSISIEQAKATYQISVYLAHLQGIVPEKIWRCWFFRKEAGPAAYMIGIYASHCDVWYVAKYDPSKTDVSLMHNYSFLYINNDYCYKEIIDVRKQPYGDWGGFIDDIFRLNIPESDYLTHEN